MSPGRLLREFRRERLAGSREQVGIIADRHEPAATLQPMARVGFDGCENARDLPRLLYPRHRGFDCRANLRMRVVAGMPETAGQVAGPDEQAVDAVDRGNR